MGDAYALLCLMVHFITDFLLSSWTALTIARMVRQDLFWPLLVLGYSKLVVGYWQNVNGGMSCLNNS